MALQHLRSNTASKRPTPASMADGQLAVNTNATSPGLFFKDAGGALIKVGPVHVGTSAPNSSPAGSSGNAVGEQWLDTSGGGYVLKIWDGSAWRSEVGEFVDATGDTMTGDLVMNNADIVFEGSTEDGFETTLTVVDPTADRTITLPNVTGTVVTTGDSGTVTSTMILDGTIVDADVNASAAIAGTKIDPDFGSQTVETTGVFSAAGGAAATPSIAFTGDLNTGIYSPGADQVAISTNGTGRLFVDSSGNVGIDSSGPAAKLDVNGDGGASLPAISAGTAGIARRTATAVSFCAFSIIAGTASSSRLNFGNTDDEDTGRIQYLHTDNSFQVFTNATEKLRITSDGKLGLGTSSPSEQLELGSGNIKLANVGRIFSADGTRGSVQISAPNDNTSRRVTYGNNYYLDSDGTYKQDATNIGGSLIEMTATNSDYGIFKVIQKQDPDIGGATREALVVDTSGNVGIGTTSPGSALHVVGDIRCDGVDLDGPFEQASEAVSALDVDCSAGNYFTKAISSNSTFTFSNIPTSGTAYSFTLEVDVTGSSTAITWPASVEWPGDTAPSLTDTKTHLFMFVTNDGGTTWRGAALVDYTT